MVPTSLIPCAARRSQAQHVAAPSPGVLLLLDDALSRLPRLDGGPLGFEGLRKPRFQAVLVRHVFGNE